MVIIDEKSQNPPPPYVPSTSAPPPFRPLHHRGGLGTLPSHILLHVVYMTFPQTPGINEGRVERQRKTLYWLSVGLRLVNRSFYVGQYYSSILLFRIRKLILPPPACMHVLRSTYLPAYESFIRFPYSSDPFPHNPVPSCLDLAPSSPLQTIQRETKVLDLFIALKVREDVWMDDSELHLEREESFKDLFDLNQPRSRLEDLIRVYGEREGIVIGSPAAPPNASSSPTNSSSQRNRVSFGLNPIPFSALSISFSTRRVGLVVTTTTMRKRTIVEVSRGRDEKLEVAAKKLVRELAIWLSSTPVR